MCQFFSVTSNGSGQIKYFDWELRKKCLSGELDYNPDSHTSINDYFGFKGIREDKRNKYEYNPITGKFIVDKINGKNDRKSVEKKVRAIDFKTIIPQLNIHPIINPFEINPTISIDIAIQRLKQWDSVGASVRASVWDSVGASVWAYVGASVWDSVRDSVWAYVGAYTSSLFPNIQKWEYIDHKAGKNPFQPCIDLWRSGLVPSFDGTTWRLSGKSGILYELKKEDIE